MTWPIRKTLLFLALGALPAAAASANEISVLTACYGQSGDSAPGCRKNMIVRYGCAGQGTAHLAQIQAEASGSIVRLSCVTNEMRR